MSAQINYGTYQQNDTCVETGCNGTYSTLSGYNTTPGAFVAGPSVPSQTAIPATIIVPTWGGAGYNTLMNNVPFQQLNTSGYFNVTNAYPSYGNNCQAYTTSLGGGY